MVIMYKNLFQLKQTCSPYLALYIEWKRVTIIVERTITLEIERSKEQKREKEIKTLQGEQSRKIYNFIAPRIISDLKRTNITFADCTLQGKEEGSISWDSLFLDFSQSSTLCTEMPLGERERTVQKVAESNPSIRDC